MLMANGSFDRKAYPDDRPEISAEQEVVDRAYRELDRRLESARASLAATQASPVPRGNS